MILDGEMKRRPTHEEHDKDMNRLYDYVTIKSFKELQRIVSQKTEACEFEELKLVVEGHKFLIEKTNLFVKEIIAPMEENSRKIAKNTVEISDIS